MKKINKKSFFYFLACISLCFLFILPFFYKSNIKTIASAESTSDTQLVYSTQKFMFVDQIFYKSSSSSYPTALSQIPAYFYFELDLSNKSYPKFNFYRAVYTSYTSNPSFVMYQVDLTMSVMLYNVVDTTSAHNLSYVYVNNYGGSILQPDFANLFTGLEVTEIGRNTTLSNVDGLPANTQYIKIQFLGFPWDLSMYIPYTTSNTINSQLTWLVKNQGSQTIYFNEDRVYQIREQEIRDSAYQSGLIDGKNILDTNSSNYIQGYSYGYEKGLENAPDQISFDTSIKNFVLSLFNVPASIFGGLFNLEYAGFNLGGLIALLVTIPIVIFVVKWLT